MLQVDNYILFGLRAGEKSQNYNAAHAVFSVPGFFSLDTVNPNVPQISFLIFHHTEFKRTQANGSAGP